ncbi:TPA: glucose-6-phosphate dehydrogenase, partial [Candidatus Poribacteria bacterium]|nr:glucose-6-phosphate dehydrogenase [Candidatus Poribacteria bacterium]
MDSINIEDIRGSFCVETRPGPCGIIIFSASGDLTYRKLIPALFSLYNRDLLPNEFYILGCARTAMSDEEFRLKAHKAIVNAVKSLDQAKLNSFLNRLSYHAGDYYDTETYRLLSAKLDELDKGYSIGGNRIFYLAVPPDLYCPIIQMLNSVGLTNEPDDGRSYVHIVFEKPFGRDLKSAMALDKELHHVLLERQIYRIDHYLGKETVQNILMFRFANAVFEPIWNRRYIDHVQITVAETIGIEHRAGYFERSGLLRDIFQNHILQMLALVSMEPPTSFNADRVRDERVKLLRSLRPFPLDDLDKFIVRGQYISGKIDGEDVVGYRDEKDVNPNSQ